MKGFIAAALLCSMFACGKDDDDDDVVSTAVTTAYEGTWTLACTEAPAGSGLYVSGTDVYASNVLTRTITFGENANCSSPYATDVEKFTVVVGSALTADTYKIDFTQISSTETLLSQDIVTSSNANQRYGYTNWAINVAKDIANRSMDAGEDPEDANGTKSYSVVKLASGNLTYGFPAATTEASRPTTTSGVLTFSK